MWKNDSSSHDCRIQQYRGGEFYFDDTKINNMEPSKRNIGMVFQTTLFFPHLTVRDNVAFGLKQKKVPKEELIQQTNKYLELMQIAQYAGSEAR